MNDLVVRVLVGIGAIVATCIVLAVTAILLSAAGWAWTVLS